MIKQIPRTQYICGVAYTVKRVNRMEDDRVGDVDTDRKVIRLKKGAFNEWAIFIHECLHALYFETGIGFKSEKYEHEIIDSTTEFITALVQYRGVK